MANKDKYVTVTPVEKSTGTPPLLKRTTAPVKKIEATKPGSDVQLPVQKPGQGEYVQTMETDPDKQFATTNDTVQPITPTGEASEK